MTPDKKQATNDSWDRLLRILEQTVELETELRHLRPSDSHFYQIRKIGSDEWDAQITIYMPDGKQLTFYGRGDSPNEAIARMGSYLRKALQKSGEEEDDND